jgi:hypothetical protein
MAGTFLGGILGAKLLYKIQAVWGAGFLRVCAFCGRKMLFFKGATEYVFSSGNCDRDVGSLGIGADQFWCRGRAVFEFGTGCFAGLNLLAFVPSASAGRLFMRAKRG